MKRPNEDSQRTHYWLKRTNSLSSDPVPALHTESSFFNVEGTTLTRLLLASEPIEHVRLRQELLNSVWHSQQLKIDAIYHNWNSDLFEELLNYVNKPTASERSKISVGFLQLGSNIANNLRIFKELELYLYNGQLGVNLRIVKLSSACCSNIKSTIREIVKQITLNTRTRSDELNEYGSDDEETKVKDEKIDDEFDDDEAEDYAELDQKISKNYHGKISYDFDIVADWYSNLLENDELINSDNFRLIILLQDSDAISNNVLNQLMKVVHSYSTIIPMKVVVGLSSVSSNIRSWLDDNILNELRLKIEGTLFKNVDNKQLGHSICEEMFLQYPKSLTSELELTLSPKLASVLLNRFQYSNNSIDGLVSSFKLSYMTHFYQLPLPVILSEKFQTSCTLDYVRALRKLPSFQSQIELKYREEKYKEIKDLLEDDECVLDLLHESQKADKLRHFIHLNSMNILFELQEGISNHRAKMEIFQLIVSREIVSSIYLNELFQDLLRASFTIIESHMNYIKSIPHESEFGIDMKLKTFKLKLQLDITTNSFINNLKKYLQMYTEDLVNLPFHEVFTISGGSMIEPYEQQLIKEKNSNLILNLLRPEIRASLETQLENSDILLSGKLVSKISGLEPDYKWDKRPFITRLFNVYKDAPVNINIYDFFVAFKESFNRKTTVEYLFKDVDEPGLRKQLEDETNHEVWEKLLYSWFLQGCFEFLLIGIIKEKPKGDVVEKVIWKGV